ncbi:MAG: hypothetical protein KJZ64_16255 [Sphingomonadaceae bacterium]|nr:hypothetical protein [Sphingomonadaceae bacterium]
MEPLTHTLLPRIAALALVAALAACASPTPAPAPPPVATPSPRPNPAPVLAPPPARAWDREPATPGTWRHRVAGRDSIAEFVGSDGRMRFQLACTADRDVELAVIGSVADARSMTVRTRTLERAVTASAMESSIISRLSGRDPLLAAMAYSRGRFAVETAGLPALYLPAWPEVTRVIDDCQ